MDKQPNCFIVGAMKAGTTAVANALSLHKQVWLPELKEPQYFMNRAFYYSSKINFTEYTRLYEESTHTAVDASTWYLYDPDSAQLIYNYNPSAKIIAILRNPADRAFSHWQYLSRDDRCPHKSFKQAVKEEMEMIAREDWIHPFPYLAMGFYARNLQRYYNIFPPEQIRVFLYDDLKVNPQQLLSEIQEFLNLDPQNLPIEGDVNKSGLPASRTAHRLLNTPNPLRKLAKSFLPYPSLRKQLIKTLNRANLKRQTLGLEAASQLSDYFAEDIAELESLVGMTLSCWRHVPCEF